MAHVNPTVSHEHSLTGEKLSLLAVFARPEDESFGPAGTLAKYASEGIAVSLVTATRRAAPDSSQGTAHMGETGRDRVCSCRTCGIRRACLFDYHPGELTQVEGNVIEERLVRMIREVRPQVIITFGDDWLTGGSDYRILSAATRAAFYDAGNSTRFVEHTYEDLSPYAPQKLYHCVLPQSIVTRWGVQGLATVPDALVTTVLDVSAYGEAMKNALYCQRHGALDFIRWLVENPRVEWTAEYYALVESRLRRKPRREKDLFAGLR